MDWCNATNQQARKDHAERIAQGGRDALAELKKEKAMTDNPKCKWCDGKGWYATGPTDNAIQLQCHFCYGTGIEKAQP